MNILLASSEVVPLAKTGGLADVCGALPVELARLGHRVHVFLPAYRNTDRCGLSMTQLDVQLDIPIGNKIVSGGLIHSRLPNSEVDVYLVDQPHYFDRAELYREKGQDYRDNCERFVFFSRAVLECIRLLNLDVDVVHANDWQTSLIPAYLKIEYENAPGYDHVASLLTIHNMAYQGQFWHWDMLLTGLDWKYFNWHQMEYYGKLNLLKTGIVFADSINTVSPRYALEIQSQPLGCGLESVLHYRRDVLSGIINGVDYKIWNPATDSFLTTNYDVDSWKAGKADCKRYLREALELPQDEQAPLIGMIGRLADQKGFDLVARIIGRWVESSDAQWVILGTGEAEYHTLFQRLASQFPHKVAAKLEFSDRWAHLIEAGADIFLMPSRFEPCGLNQLYSLKYGTVPVVHATGGLADTIVDATPDNLATGRANGFAFSLYDPAALEESLRRALETFQREPTTWEQLVVTGMNQDWSWAKSARKYVELYETTIARAKLTVCA